MKIIITKKGDKMWFDENFMIKFFIKIINESVSDLGATVFNFINKKQ